MIYALCVEQLRSHIAVLNRLAIFNNSNTARPLTQKSGVIILAMVFAM